MNKDTLNMAMRMQQQNPNLAGPQPRQPVQNPLDSANLQSNATQQPPMAAANQPPPPAGMENLQNLMSGPQNLEALSQNKDMIKSMFGMVKSNPQMLRMAMQQMGTENPASRFVEGRSDAQLMQYMGWVEKVVNLVLYLMPVIKLVKKYYKFLGVLFVALILKKIFL